MGETNSLTVTVQPSLPRHGGDTYQLRWSFTAPPKPLFQLGQIIATPAAINFIEDRGLSGADLLARHQSGDWGDVSKADRQDNELAVQGDPSVISTKYGYLISITSKYGKGDDSIWVSTSGDYSNTHLLQPFCDLSDT